MASLRLLVLGPIVLLLSACGGGGGGSAGGGGGGGSGQSFTIATNSVTFDADVNGSTPAPQFVQGSITGENAPIYLVVAMTNVGIENVSVALTSDTTGQLTIFPRPPSQIGPGTHSDTIQVRACLDPNCTQQVSGSPRTITVTYGVRGLRVTPATVILSAVEGSSPAFMQVSLASGPGSNWTTTIAYQGAAGWLHLAPTGGSSSEQVSFSADPIAPGAYNATVTFSSGTSVFDVPVTYTVHSNLAASPPHVELSAVSGQTAEATNTNVTLFSASGTTTFTTSVVYGPGASGWLGPTGNVAPGLLTLQPQDMSMAPGTYTASITLTPSNGSAPLVLPVTYTLQRSALTFSPATPTFTIDASSTAAAQFITRTVQTGDTGAPLTWTASDDVPWLQVTASGASGQNAVLTLVPSALEAMPNGTHEGRVNFVANGPSVVNVPSQITVRVDIDLPTVVYAAPYVAYFGEQKPIVLRGSGFDQPGVGPVMFDNEAVESFQVVSDTEIRVTPPAIGSPSRPVVWVGNGLDLTRSSAELVVRGPPRYGTQNFDFDIGTPAGSRVLYDAERDYVFAIRPAAAGGAPIETLDSVLRFHPDPDGFGASFTFRTHPGIEDIALSPNGKILYVLTSDALHAVNPASLMEIGPPRPMPSVSGRAGHMVMTNDGRLVLPWLGQIYAPLTHTFEPIAVPLGDGAIEASADGSRLVFEAATGTGMVNLGSFDSSTGQFALSTQARFTSPLSVDRTGTRFAHGAELFNADFSLYGSAGAAGYFSRLSPPGDRLHALTYSPARYHLFDVTAGVPAFPEVHGVDVPVGAAVLGVSLSGEHVFIVDAGHFIVFERL
jgi:hypothetical protein